MPALMVVVRTQGAKLNLIFSELQRWEQALHREHKLFMPQPDMVETSSGD